MIGWLRTQSILSLRYKFRAFLLPGVGLFVSRYTYNFRVAEWL